MRHCVSNISIKPPCFPALLPDCELFLEVADPERDLAGDLRIPEFGRDCVSSLGGSTGCGGAAGVARSCLAPGDAELTLYVLFFF